MEVVGIVGSRFYQPLVKVIKYVRELKGKNVKVVSGGAHGPDNVAIGTAIYAEIPWKVFKPDFKAHGIPACYFIRNQQIVDAADRLVAFWDGESGGTKDTIDRAKKKGIPVEIIYEH